MTGAGLTTADVARRYRVGEDKVRAWIKSGELAAINTAAALCRPRYVVTHEAIELFEQTRSTKPTPKTPRRKKAPVRDFYPD